MSPTVSAQLVTGADFAKLPEPREGGKLELVRGSVVVLPPVGPAHGECSAALGALLLGFSRRAALGRVRASTHYWLATKPDHIRSPDISFVSATRARSETIKHGCVDGLPELAVEITSPTDTDRAVQEKVDDYLAAGVSRVWVVRPELETVTVFRGNRDAHVFTREDTLTSDDAGFAVEGFALPLSELFS